MNGRRHCDRAHADPSDSLRNDPAECDLLAVAIGVLSTLCHRASESHTPEVLRRSPQRPWRADTHACASEKAVDDVTEVSLGKVYTSATENSDLRVILSSRSASYCRGAHRGGCPGRSKGTTGSRALPATLNPQTSTPRQRAWISPRLHRQHRRNLRDEKCRL